GARPDAGGWAGRRRRAHVRVRQHDRWGTGPMSASTPATRPAAGPIRFSDAQLAEVRRLQALYPERQAALLPVLRMAQEAFGYISPAGEMDGGGRVGLSPPPSPEGGPFSTPFLPPPGGAPRDRGPSHPPGAAGRAGGGREEGRRAGDAGPGRVALRLRGSADDAGRRHVRGAARPHGRGPGPGGAPVTEPILSRHFARPEARTLAGYRALGGYDAL